MSLPSDSCRFKSFTIHAFGKLVEELCVLPLGEIIITDALLSATVINWFTPSRLSPILLGINLSGKNSSKNERQYCNYESNVIELCIVCFGFVTGIFIILCFSIAHCIFWIRVRVTRDCLLLMNITYSV